MKKEKGNEQPTIFEILGMALIGLVIIEFGLNLL